MSAETHGGEAYPSHLLPSVSDSDYVESKMSLTNEEGNCAVRLGFQPAGLKFFPALLHLSGTFFCGCSLILSPWCETPASSGVFNSDECQNPFREMEPVTEDCRLMLGNWGESPLGCIDQLN